MDFLISIVYNYTKIWVSTYLGPREVSVGIFSA